jgi:DNA-binding GntR family transcriptional regulator
MKSERSPRLVSAKELASQKLKSAIVDGRYKPGVRLVETELAEELGISRGTIRETLRELASEGLVVMRQNRGAVVADISVADVLEVYAIRAVLGTLALRQLRGNADFQHHLASRLKPIADQAREYGSQQKQRGLVDLDLAFQNEIASSSGLPRCASFFRQLSVEAKRFVNLLGVTYTDVDQILREHQELIDAIAVGDLEQAEAVWRRRFQRAAQEFLDAMNKREIDTSAWPALTALIEFAPDSAKSRARHPSA